MTDGYRAMPLVLEDREYGYCRKSDEFKVDGIDTSFRKGLHDFSGLVGIEVYFADLF